MEFRSRLEDLMSAEELIFPPSPGFGPYKSVMPPEAVAHPAKFNVYLVEFLIRRFTKHGDTVLDPMAGTGILGVIAALNGRNAVQVEIEPMFYEWMERARKNIEKMRVLGKKGFIINILGDARKLSELLKQVDTIITSPPYESALEGTSRHTRGGIASRDPKLAQSGTYSTVLSIKPGVPVMYSPNPDNIGNLKNRIEDYELLEREKNLDTLYKMLLKNGKPTYLSEMLKVYKECYKVLKPGGYCIIVVKPFIREKKVVDLPYYTWLLMERVGFILEKLYKFRLPIKSFWRVLYYNKYPEVPEIAHEYVIVAKKPE